MNRPYEKQYDASGELINPIIGSYNSKSVSKENPEGKPNRKERREGLRKKKLHSNKKGTQLVVTRTGWFTFMKFKKVFQQIGKKRVMHYVES